MVSCRVPPLRAECFHEIDSRLFLPSCQGGYSHIAFCDDILFSKHWLTVRDLSKSILVQQNSTGTEKVSQEL